MVRLSFIARFIKSSSSLDLNDFHHLSGPFMPPSYIVNLSGRLRKLSVLSFGVKTAHEEISIRIIIISSMGVILLVSIYSIIY